jgi:DNA polymerase-3 subunit gamma/tau
MIVRAGEGSVRDSLSLTDQAISHGAGAITVEAVRTMLGLADRARLIDLFEALMGGDIAAALGIFRELYEAGADPVTLTTDLADLTHLVTRLKIVPAAAGDVALTPDERYRGGELAQKLGLRALSRAWQILFRGIDEVARASNAVQAAEMVLIRLAYAADLPSPDELIERLAGQPAASGSGGNGGPAPRGNGGGVQALRLDAPPAAAPRSAPTALASPKSYGELVALAGAQRDLLVKHALEASLTPIAFAEGRIEVALVDGADPAIIQTLSARLKQWTGRNWLITVSQAASATPTIRQVRQQREHEVKTGAQSDPLVKAILDTYPGARVTRVTLREDEPPLPPPPSDDELEAQFDADFGDEDEDE